MILSVYACLIAVSVLFMGSIIYCIWQIERDTDSDDDSITELLV